MDRCERIPSPRGRNTLATHGLGHPVDVHHKHGASVADGCHTQIGVMSPVTFAAMKPDLAVTSFAVVFGLFIVVTAVLLVLALRFTFQWAAASRSQWLAEHRDDDDDQEPRQLTALVLAGGGTRGAVQIGMLQVLTEHGFVPDRIYGASVGALNGVAFAGDPTRDGVERMTGIWTGLTRDAVYPQGRLHGPWLYLQQRDSVYQNTGLRKIIDEGIDFDRLEEAAVPVEVVATSLTDGLERWFTYGPVAEAVLASTAIPAIFPPIEIDGDRFIDGGVVNNVPIRRAIDAGATRVVVLLCGPSHYEPVSPRRPVEAMLNALFISIHARFAREMSEIPPGVEIILCSGSEGGTRDFDDFSSTQALIAQGREEASEVVRRYGLGRVGDATVGTASMGTSSMGTGSIGPIGPPDSDGDRTGDRISAVPAETGGRAAPVADGEADRGVEPESSAQPDPGT
jgi:NTE family protein